MKFLFVLLLLVILEVNAFVSNDMMKLYKLSRSNPLRTAGSENRGYIPRLDPGLRLIQPQVENTPQFLSFSLDWLKDSTDNIQVTRIPLDTLFSKLADKVSAMALKAAQFFKSIFKAFVAVLPVMLTMAIGLNRKTTTSQVRISTNFPWNFLYSLIFEDLPNEHYFPIKVRN